MPASLGALLPPAAAAWLKALDESVPSADAAAGWGDMRQPQPPRPPPAKRVQVDSFPKVYKQHHELDNTEEAAMQALASVSRAAIGLAEQRRLQAAVDATNADPYADPASISGFEPVSMGPTLACNSRGPNEGTCTGPFDAFVNYRNWRKFDYSPTFSPAWQAAEAQREQAQADVERVLWENRGRRRWAPFQFPQSAGGMVGTPVSARARFAKFLRKYVEAAVYGAANMASVDAAAIALAVALTSKRPALTRPSVHGSSDGAKLARGRRRNQMAAFLSSQATCTAADPSKVSRQVPSPAEDLLQTSPWESVR